MLKKEPEEDQSNQPEPEVVEAEDVETLKQELAQEKEQAESYMACWQRTQADFVNYKRRAEQERGEFSKFANSSLIICLLPILSDLKRAVDCFPEEMDLRWVDGIECIERKFRTTLEAQGVTPIKALGEPFDPRFHEAIRQDKGEEGIVIEELQMGYTLHDRLLCPAIVVVGNGEEEKKEDK